jgi:hypothetical protein
MLDEKIDAPLKLWSSDGVSFWKNSHRNQHCFIEVFYSLLLNGLAFFAHKMKRTGTIFFSLAPSAIVYGQQCIIGLAKVSRQVQWAATTSYYLGT